MTWLNIHYVVFAIHFDFDFYWAVIIFLTHIFRNTGHY